MLRKKQFIYRSEYASWMSFLGGIGEAYFMSIFGTQDKNILGKVYRHMSKQQIHQHGAFYG